MAWKPGRFVWRELMTEDVSAAKAFYGELFGWGFEDVPMGPDMTYVLAKLRGANQCGLMNLPAPGVPPNWTSYLSVEDVDAAAGRVAELGGKVLFGPEDIPGVGRFATVTDPQGAHFNLFRGSDGDEVPDMPAVGDFCWESLHTSDPKAAVQFYTQLAGWNVSEYAGQPIFSVGQMMMASVAPAPPGAPPHWLTYVAVASLADTIARVTRLGGNVIEPEIPVPGMGVFGLFQDPQGAMLMVFESRS